MRSLWRDIRSGGANETVPVSVYDWAKMWAPGGQVNYQGRQYQSFNMSGASTGANSIVYTCQRMRTAVFSEARLQWQRLRNGRAASNDLFGTQELSVFDRPWPGASIRDLLAVAEMDIAWRGNSYWIRDGEYFARLEPSTVKVITRGVLDPITGNRVGESLLGYAVTVDHKVTIFPPEDIAHYKPIPSSSNPWIGQSWIGQCLDDVAADNMLTHHKKAQIENGANLTHVVSLDPNLDPTEFDGFVRRFKELHRGPATAGETLFLQGGSDIKTVTQTFEELALKATQGAGETRIASCAGVSPVLLGLSEGLAGSSLNQGNFVAAKQNFVDATLCPNWSAFCGAFESLIAPPASRFHQWGSGQEARLWYDKRDIPFLAADEAARAAVLTQQATVIRTLTDGGYTPDSVIACVTSGDFSGLVHTGLVPVQLRPPGSEISPVAVAVA
jgi:hypothetical protein